MKNSPAGPNDEPQSSSGIEIPESAPLPRPTANPSKTPTTTADPTPHASPKTPPPVKPATADAATPTRQSLEPIPVPDLLSAPPSSDAQLGHAGARRRRVLAALLAVALVALAGYGAFAAFTGDSDEQVATERVPITPTPPADEEVAPEADPAEDELPEETAVVDDAADPNDEDVSDEADADAADDQADDAEADEAGEADPEGEDASDAPAAGDEVEVAEGDEAAGVGAQDEAADPEAGDSDSADTADAGTSDTDAVGADEASADGDGQPAGEPAADSAAAASPVAESMATVRNGQIFLEGAVPTQEAGDALAALAVEILGPDNVFNNYVVDPAAGDPNLGNITVEDTITFEPNSAVLEDPNNPLLGQGVALMTIRPAMTITIVGHTDNVGTPAVNDRLSLQRAETVKAYFVAQGIDPDRLTTSGAGSSEPLVSNDTDDGRAQNRRIQFFLENILGEA